MHLIGQNDRAMCKTHRSWRCIQCHEAHSTSFLGAGWAGHSHRMCAPCASIKSMFERSENITIVLAGSATEPLVKQEAR